MKHEIRLRSVKYTAAGLACSKWGVETKKYSTTHELDITDKVVEIYVIWLEVFIYLIMSKRNICLELKTLTSPMTCHVLVNKMIRKWNVFTIINRTSQVVRYVTKACISKSHASYLLHCKYIKQTSCQEMILSPGLAVIKSGHLYLSESLPKKVSSLDMNCNCLQDVLQSHQDGVALRNESKKRGGGGSKK